MSFPFRVCVCVLFSLSGVCVCFVPLPVCEFSPLSVVVCVLFKGVACFSGVVWLFTGSFVCSRGCVFLGVVWFLSWVVCCSGVVTLWIVCFFGDCVFVLRTVCSF